MSEKHRQKNKEGSVERGARFYRNVNVLGALALGGAALVAPPVLAAGLGVVAGVNLLQAAGAEVVRGYARNRRMYNNKTKENGR